MRKHVLIVPFSAAFVLLLIFWGCKKNSSSPTTPPLSQTVTLITSSPWKYDTSGIDLNDDGKIDSGDIPDTATLKPCEKDDIFTFNKDSTGLIDEGPTKCHVTDPQTDPLSWYLTSNQTILNVTSSTVLNGSLNISSVTSTNLVLYKDTTYLAFSFRYLIILQH
jgi:hypothetical protein